MSLLERNLLFLKRTLGIARPDQTPEGQKPGKRAAGEIRISVNKLKISLKVLALIIVYSIIFIIYCLCTRRAQQTPKRKIW